VPSRYEVLVSQDGKSWKMVASEAGRTGAGLLPSALADKYLNPEQGRQRQELVRELETLR
jgi:hypothetical protein